MTLVPTRRRTRRRALAPLALALCVGAAPLRAQAGGTESLEQTYARLCGNGQQGETCDALRQAMLAKLSRRDSVARPAPAAEPYWGHYLDHVDAPQVSVLVEGMYAMNYDMPIASYTWEVPGRVLRVSTRQADGSYAKIGVLEWDDARRGLAVKNLDGTAGLWTWQEDGSLRQESDGVRITERKYNNGIVEQRTEAKRDSAWQVAWVYHRSRYAPETIDLMRSIHANMIKVAHLNAQIPAKYRDPEYQRQIQERAARREKENGGWFRSLVGAGLGLAAANAAGMDATQAAGMAAKGAAAMNPGSQAAQLAGATGDALLQGSGAGASSGAAAGGAGRRASYPTRPNVLAGQAACAMMDEGNYRQVGTAGGTDVQLRTMCAQAYEYYVMYKRAIAQGYAEADANRTYAAHEQSARNAIAFFTNNRAR